MPDTFKGGFIKDHGLRDQIQRATTSVMANIAEGFDGGSRREFTKLAIHFVPVAALSRLAIAWQPGGGTALGPLRRLAEPGDENASEGPTRSRRASGS